MRLAARLIATVAVAFAMAPALYADNGTKAEAKATMDTTAASVSVSGAVDPAKADPSADPPPLRSSISGQSQLGGSSQPVPTAHQRDELKGYPKIEWFLGYSFWRATPMTLSNRMSYLQGGSTSVAYNFNRYFGLVADVGGFANSRLRLFTPTASDTVNANGSAYTFAFGPRFSYRRNERFTPFVQALFGEAYASSVNISGCTGESACTPLGSDMAFATLLGAGFDIKISRHIALRLLEGDFLLTHFKNPFSTDGQVRGWQDNARFSTGIVFRFGGTAPPPFVALMTAACSAVPETVLAGSGDPVAVRAYVSNPGQYSLTYSWSEQEGAINGTGAEIRWISSNREPGAYTVSVRVNNSQNGSAVCSASIRVIPRPNRPPTISCSADRRSVTAGEPVEITAAASDPDDDPLSFSWTASGGKIETSTSSVRFQTAGLPPGSYTITGRVDDGHSGTADCAASVEVRAPELSVEVKDLETRLALHSIYFPTARPTEVNPTGGLVESQRAVLLSLASDFSRYLRVKPEAHLILEGHADSRGSIDYNKQLTERRVELTKNFLAENGVPAESIETRALGKQEDLDAAQVKQLIEENPDLSVEERQKIEGNLQVVVLASNRRVDISLDTTGQQSVRRYPFNAKDSLRLLNTESGETEKPTTPSATGKGTEP